MSFKEKFIDFKDKFKANKKLQITIGIVAVVIIVAIGGAIIYSNSKKEVAPTFQTYTIPENEKIFINGLVVPKQSKEISAPANGSTPDIRVSNGQSVKTGDVLYIVKDEAAIQEISSIKTQINNLIREKSSLQSGDVGLITINNQIATLNTSLSVANSKAYTKVKAPFDGKVYLTNNSENNSRQEAGGSIMTVQTTDYVMNGQISEQDLSKIKKDMTADVTVLSTGDTVKGRISYISDRPVGSNSNSANMGGDSDGSSLSFYSVVLSFDTQEGIIDGYHTQATLEIESDKFKIPSASILHSGDDVYVMAVIDGTLRKINIEVISEGNNYSVVTGNLNQSDIIIKNPTLKMKEGDAAPLTSDSKDDAKGNANGESNGDSSSGSEDNSTNGSSPEETHM